MNESEYRKSDGVSRSELWRIRESPEKFIYFKEHPEPPTPTLVFGSLAHKALLEPNTLAEEFAVCPGDINKKTKEGREQYAAFVSMSDGKRIVSEEDYKRASEMATAAMRQPYVARLLKGEHEKPYYWTDAISGELCKIRVDSITTVNGNPIIVDYKTTTDASTEAFTRSMINLGYDFQAAMYAEGVEKNTGVKPKFVFIVQEKTAPYAVNILQADEYVMSHGYEVFRELIGIYHDCKQTGNWFGYLGAFNVINDLTLPAWLKKEVSE